MNLGIRFSTPVLDELDLNLLTEEFEEDIEEVIDILENAPYEISILISMLKRLECRINFIE